MPRNHETGPYRSQKNVKRENMLNHYQGKCFRACIHHILEAPNQINEEIGSNIKEE